MHFIILSLDNMSIPVEGIRLTNIRIIDMEVVLLYGDNLGFSIKGIVTSSDWQAPWDSVALGPLFIRIEEDSKQKIKIQSLVMRSYITMGMLNVDLLINGQFFFNFPSGPKEVGNFTFLNYRNRVNNEIASISDLHEIRQNAITKLQINMDIDDIFINVIMPDKHTETQRLCHFALDDGPSTATYEQDFKTDEIPDIFFLDRYYRVLKGTSKISLIRDSISALDLQLIVAGKALHDKEVICCKVIFSSPISKNFEVDLAYPNERCISSDDGSGLCQVYRYYVGTKEIEHKSIKTDELQKITEPNLSIYQKALLEQAQLFGQAIVLMIQEDTGTIGFIKQETYNFRQMIRNTFDFKTAQKLIKDIHKPIIPWAQRKCKDALEDGRIGKAKKWSKYMRNLCLTQEMNPLFWQLLRKCNKKNENKAYGIVLGTGSVLDKAEKIFKCIVGQKKKEKQVVLKAWYDKCIKEHGFDY